MICVFIYDTGHQLCYLVIQELAMNRKAPAQLRDDVFLSICHCVSEILEKHAVLFRGMVNRVDVSYYQMFASIAHELFEVRTICAIYMH